MHIEQLEHAAIGYPVTRHGVSFFPVYIHQHAPQIATGPGAGVTIEEKPDAAVPTLQVRNTTATAVLLVEGETVNGGHQNRVLNVSVLVPAGATIDIPVSCVEQGRWGGGREFGRSRVFASRRVRREKTRGVTASVMRNGGRQADQGGVWSAVHHELHRLDAANGTAALAGADDVFARDHRLADVATELVGAGPLPGQCGVVVSHGSRIVAADVFADPDAFACHWEAIIRSHLLDVPQGVRGTPSATRAVRFLRKFAAATDRVAPAVGLGREHHINNSKVVGQALVWDDILVHASAFALAA